MLLVRKGKLDLITRNHFHADGAATYIGLQAVHTAFGFLMLWIAFTSVAMVLQFKEFWQFVYSQYPLLLAFVFGFPFISKILTKLYRRILTSYLFDPI